MSTENNNTPTVVSQPKSPMTVKSLFEQENVKKKFHEMLGKKAQGFITSVLQIAMNNDLLSKAEPMSIYNAAAVAATMDLPINQNLGFAYIVPYKGKAQFQMGYKGFIQLAQRSGQFKTISATPVYEGQLIEQNPLTGFVFDFTKKTSEKVMGYAAYFSLINGFEKTFYMTHEELTAHATKYSQSFKKGLGIWKDDFDSMAIKTVLKLLLSKYAPLSVEMQKAVLADQGVVKNAFENEYEYADHEEVREEISLEDLQLEFDMKKDQLEGSEYLDAERILKNKEKLSYKKLKNLLEKY